MSEKISLDSSDKKVLYVELIFNCLNDVQELFCQ